MFATPFPNRDGSVLFLPTGAFVPWAVPPNAREIFILAQGAGAGGGSGFTRIAGAAGGGGGGGGSGGRSIIRVPVALLPPVLYIRAGAGGLAGINGGECRVAMRPTATDIHVVVRTNGGSTGGSGTASAAGTSGAAGAAISSSQATLSQLAPPLFLGGMAGVTGGAQTGAVGSNITWGSGNSLLTSGGAGGAGTTSADFSGGSVINGVDGYYGNATGGAAGSNDGAQGTGGWAPPASQGGAGGGSSNAGIGGGGGNGGPGSGGGGGGAGTVGGTGGRGGDGFVWILPLY